VRNHVMGEAGWFHLNLGNLELRDAGARQVARLLAHSPSQVTKVMMEGNMIGPEGAGHIADMLARNTNIICLILQSNEIGDAGAAALAGALRVNATLEVLGLPTNFIGDEGGVALGEALGVNRHLRVLSLNHNACGDAAARALAAGLAPNRWLEGLSFAFNCVTDDGAVAFADAVERNAKLRHLWLNGNPIGQVGFEALNDRLKRNTSLEQVRLTLGGFEQYEGAAVKAGEGFQGLGTGPHRTSLEFKRDRPVIPGAAAYGTDEGVRASVDASALYAGTGRKAGDADADPRSSADTTRMSRESAATHPGRPSAAFRPLSALAEDEVVVGTGGASEAGPAPGAGGGDADKRASAGYAVPEPSDSRIWQPHTWPEEAGEGVRRAALTTSRASDVSLRPGDKARFRASLDQRRQSRGISLDIERVQRDARLLVDTGHGPLPAAVK